MSLDAAQSLDTYMTYEDSMLIAAASSGQTADFYPDHRMTLRGSDMQYTAGIVLNDEEDMVSDWYALRVSGEHADEVRLEVTEGGYLFWAASPLENITVTAHNDDWNAKLTFSTDYQRVKLYEINEYTIGAAADADGDGSFETLLAKSDPLVIGDTDSSGTLDILDVITLNKSLLGVTKLDAQGKLCADTNSDGHVDSTDSLNLLRAIVGLVTLPV